MAFLTVVALLAGATEQSAYAQKGVGDQAGVARQIPKPSLETLTGTILAVETQPCEMTTGQGRIGSHVLLKTEEGEKLNIHLGWADAVAETAKQLTVAPNPRRRCIPVVAGRPASSLWDNRPLVALRDSEDFSTIIEERLLCSPDELSALTR